jgi:ABC-type transport system substrate-binding protein
VTPAAQVEDIFLNLTDPWREVEGERSSLKAPHPILADPLVRRALGLLIDRATIASELYGRFGSPTGNVLNGPAPFVSPMFAGRSIPPARRRSWTQPGGAVARTASASRRAGASGCSSRPVPTRSVRRPRRW